MVLLPGFGTELQSINDRPAYAELSPATAGVPPDAPVLDLKST